MSKRLFSYFLFFLSIALYGQELKPYEQIGKSIQMNQNSIQNPVYKIPCGNVNIGTYFESAIYVGNAVTKPLSYFAQKAPRTYYINSSKSISILEKGKSFELRLTVNQNKTADRVHLVAYADWDRDGKFETNLGKKQIVLHNTQKLPSTSYSINIPSEANSGKHRIRVFLTNNELPSLSATESVIPGMIYDFVFYVTENSTHEGILVNASSNNLSLGYAIISTSSSNKEGRYPSNSNVMVKAIKYPKASFIGWSDGIKIVSTDLEYTFTVTTPTFLIAVFAKPTPTLEAPQISTAEAPIWYQIKNAQTDSRLDSYIVYEENPAHPYTTKIHLEKPAEVSDKFLWRLEASTSEQIKLISKNANIQMFSNGNIDTNITPEKNGSNFLIKPSGNANGSYSILYNGIDNKLLNGNPQWELLLYSGGIGTGSGWYFYRVSNELTSVALTKEKRINIYVQDKQLVILGTHLGENIKIYNLLGQNILSTIARDEESRIYFSAKGSFIVTIQNKNKFIDIQKIII